MKRRWLIVFLGIFLLNFVSAEVFGDVFDSIGWENIWLMAIFLVSLSVINFSLSKSFGKTSPIISIAISFAITASAYFSGFDFDGFVLNIGISNDLIYTILPILILLGLIFGIIKLKAWLPTSIGALLILMAIFTDWVYQESIIVILGIILMVVGLFWIWRIKKKTL